MNLNPLKTRENKGRRNEILAIRCGSFNLSGREAAVTKKLLNQPEKHEHFRNSPRNYEIVHC